MERNILLLLVQRVGRRVDSYVPCSHWERAVQKRYGRQLAANLAFVLILWAVTQRTRAADEVVEEAPDAAVVPVTATPRRRHRLRRAVALLMAVSLVPAAAGAAAADDVVIEDGPVPILVLPSDDRLPAGIVDEAEPPASDGTPGGPPANDSPPILVVEGGETDDTTPDSTPDSTPDTRPEIIDPGTDADPDAGDSDPDPDDADAGEAPNPDDGRDLDEDPEAGEEAEPDDTATVEPPVLLPSRQPAFDPDDVPFEDPPAEDEQTGDTDTTDTTTLPVQGSQPDPATNTGPAPPGARPQPPRASRPARTEAQPPTTRPAPLVAEPGNDVAPAGPDDSTDDGSPPAAPPGDGDDGEEEIAIGSTGGGSTTGVAPSLMVTTRDGATVGPPGALLVITAGDHGACDTAFFFFAGRRIASARPGADGTAVARNVSAPGAARPGAQPVTSSCSAAGTPVLQAASFDITAAAAHRSTLVTSLSRPDQILLDPQHIGLSVALVLLFLLLVAWPADLFNDTLEENYDEVRRWFRRGEPRERPRPSNARAGAVFAAFTTVLAVLYGLLEPAYGFDRSSVALTIGLMVGLTAVTFVLAVPEIIYGKRAGERGMLQVLPATLLVAAGLVAVSRVVGFEPGYLYGGLAAIVFTTVTREDTQGRLAAAAAFGTLVLGVAAWAAWSAVSIPAGEAGAGFWLLTLEATLAATFATAIETAAFVLLPMRFMTGGRVMGWSRKAWAGLFAVSMLAFLHTIVRPNAGYVSPGSDAAMALVIAGVVIFAAFSFGFWAYFRFRRVAVAPTI